jgi:Fe-S-cluster containining protein
LITKEGFDFAFDESECARCQGNCCIGESGYIWINNQEIEEFAKSFGISKKEFIDKYLYKVGYRYSIKEFEYAPNQFACIFFDMEKRQCSAYELRPTQCRSFPFWDYFKDNITEVQKECPAIKILY